jgi:hypothetical protein
MNGGTISNNTLHAYDIYSAIGGVFVDGSGSTFIMNDGTISSNKLYGHDYSDSYANDYYYAGYLVAGGGVYVGSGSTFTMNGGTISDNTANNQIKSTSSSISCLGGGVYVVGTFTMNGGTISGNKVIGDISDSDSSILGTGYGFGGGVYVADGAIFTKTAGKIAGSPTSFGVAANTAKDNGYAVYSSSPITIGGVTANAFNADLDETKNTP